MKRVLLTVLAGALAALPFVPARAGDDTEKRFEFDGLVRARFDYTNNFFDHTKTTDDYQNFTSYRAYVGLTGNFAKNVSAHVVVQDTGNFGGKTGNVFSDNSSHVTFYQGWVDAADIGGSGFSLRLGRQEHTYGTELFLGDSDYYNGQTFDGLRGRWQRGGNDLNFFHYKLYEQSSVNQPAPPFFGGPTTVTGDTNISGVTYDYMFKTMGTVGGYVLFAQDLGGHGLLPTDHSTLNTYGVRWNNGMMNGDKLNMIDWNIEAAVQDGTSRGFDETKTNLGGWVGEGWLGFNFKAGDSHGRAHVGTLMTSGFKNSSSKDGEFHNLFGDFHAHNRFGDMDWLEYYWGVADVTDINVGYEHWIGADHRVMIAYHNFTETDGDVNHLQHDKIGHEVDVEYNYQYSKNVGIEVMLGQASLNSSFAAFKTDAIQQARVQAKLNW